MSEVRFDSKGRVIEHVDHWDAAEQFYEHNVTTATKLNSGTKMVQAYMDLIEAHKAAKKYAAVVDVCERFMELTGPKEVEDAMGDVAEELVRAKARLGKTGEALAIAESLHRAAGGWQYLELKGSVLHQAGRTKEAIAAYLEVAEKVSADKRLRPEVKATIKDGVNYILSGLYVDDKNVDKAAELLQALVKAHPDNATYKNDLGYIWADADKNFAESEKLIREALDLDRKQKEKAKAEGRIDEVKENGAYLDSLGWVLFKLKKYDEALVPLKKAAEDEDGQNVEIWDHLAECYLATGKKAEAVATWEKAMTFEEQSPRDAERKRRVAEKLKKHKAGK